MSNLGTKMDLQEIFAKVKKNFTYERDIDRYGVPEYWADAMESMGHDGAISGDCEDFALWCFRLAQDKGYSPRIVACWTETGVYHAVCEVDGWIMDNRMQQVESTDKLTQLGYKWHKISDYNMRGAWFAL